MRDNEQTSKIELLSQWKLEAEFRNRNWHDINGSSHNKFIKAMQ